MQPYVTHLDVHALCFLCGIHVAQLCLLDAVVLRLTFKGSLVHYARLHVTFATLRLT